MRLSLLALPLILTGCNADESNPTIRHVTLPEKIEVVKPQFATQRFLPTNSGDLAFDTKNGTLCKTWYWDSEREAAGSSKGQPAFAAVCDTQYHYSGDEEMRLEREKQEFQKLQWEHEEKMAGKYTLSKPDR